MMSIVSVVRGEWMMHQFYVDDVHVGKASSKRWERNSHRRMYGILIFEPFRRKGYATAFRTMLIEKYKAMGVTTLSAHIKKDNVASIALYRKLGFDFIDAPVNPNNKFKITKEI